MLLNHDFYNFKVGQFNCISVSDGSFDYNPLNLISGKSEEEIKEILITHQVPTDLLISPYSYLYTDTGDHKILVDMGAGGLGPRTGNLLKNLKAAGISPEEIDTVFITHAHPDHIGGTLDNKGNPNFPNAWYLMWKNEWDFWFSDEALEEVTEHLSKLVPAEVFIKMARGQLLPVRDRIELLTEESEIFPGVSVLFTPGHTPGHMVVSFSSEGEELYFIGDSVVFPFLLQLPDIYPVYDLEPEMAAESRRRLCDLVSESNALVFGQHFHPFPGLGHIEKKAKGWNWQPLLID